MWKWLVATHFEMCNFTLNDQNILIVQSSTLIQQSVITCFEEIHYYCHWQACLTQQFDQDQVPLSSHMMQNFGQTWITDWIRPTWFRQNVTQMTRTTQPGFNYDIRIYIYIHTYIHTHTHTYIYLKQKFWILKGVGIDNCYKNYENKEQ